MGAHLDDDPKPELKSGIVGVVTNVRQALREPQMAEMDWLMDEVNLPDRADNLSSMTLVVRTNGDPAALIPSLRNAVQSIDPTLPFGTPETMSQGGERQPQSGSAGGLALWNICRVCSVAGIVEMHAMHDLALLAGLTAALAVTGILASLIPAQRAASVNANSALRSE